LLVIPLTGENSRCNGLEKTPLLLWVVVLFQTTVKGPAIFPVERTLIFINNFYFTSKIFFTQNVFKISYFQLNNKGKLFKIFIDKYYKI
jgi:hypothetical protein